MNTYAKLLFTMTIFTSVAFADDCPMDHGKYGNGKSYQNMFCKISMQADGTDASTYRTITFNKEGMLQVFTNLPGSKSSSTGARVYYLFPSKTGAKINAVDETHLNTTHTSGVTFDFDKDGKMSTSDLKMKISNEVSHKNKGGIEIENFPKGIVVDLGYRIGNTPVLNKNAVVTITDKNNKKCTMLNDEFNKISGYDAELRYKTNEALYGFLSKKCSGLDLSDLMSPMKDKINTLKKPAKLGQAPASDADITQDSSSKNIPKPKSNDSNGNIGKETKVISQ